MDRNPNDPTTSPTTSPGSSGSYGTGSTSSGTGGTSSSDSGGGFGAGGATREPVRGADMPSGGAASSTDRAVGAARETARETFDEAREQLADGAERARSWKRTMEQKLADRLHDGASKLREKANSMPVAGTSTASSTGAGTPAYAGAASESALGGSTTSGGAAVADRARSVEQNLARGMDATADWLRNGDLQTTVVEQARTNPARTLLVALGVGYLLGKTLRK